VTERDDARLLRKAIELSRNAPPSQTAFSVGSVIARHGTVLTTGYSRERGPRSHAEQVALEKAAERGLDLHGATLYTSLEPCSERKSDPRACTARILEAGIVRVVFAMREPPVFVEGEGAERLAQGGVEVLELGEEAPFVARINAHLLER
jgi:diaminohydroxyphosphoribosylaminopyrimidine deaminase / 5-amino-6-(5-phosphoribosylamino)uracil reductase